MIVETVTVVTYATCTFNMTIVNVQSTAYVKKKKLKTIQTINFNLREISAPISKPLFSSFSL